MRWRFGLGKLAWKNRVGQVITAPPVVSGSVIWIHLESFTQRTQLMGRFFGGRAGRLCAGAPVVAEGVMYLAAWRVTSMRWHRILPLCFCGIIGIPGVEMPAQTCRSYTKKRYAMGTVYEMLRMTPK